VVLPVKSKAVKAIYELLVAKPEQERNLLAFLVNKMVCG
jgi:ribosome biogenesis protein MAK21